MKDEIPESVIDSHVKKAASTKQTAVAKEEPITDDAKTGQKCNLRTVHVLYHQIHVINILPMCHFGLCLCFASRRRFGKY